MIFMSDFKNYNFLVNYRSYIFTLQQIKNYYKHFFYIIDIKK